MLEQLEKLVERGYISKRQHPTQPLYIWNYTPQCQFEQLWNRYTMAARGLITNENGRIISRPFAKFFNLDELVRKKNHLWHWYGMKYSEFWTAPFTAYEKLDGSLGVSYRDGKGRWGIATRGSFDSPQSKVANDIFKRKYGHVKLDWRLTYLFEIIYSDNRVVVDYGDVEDIFLLAVINTDTGEEYSLDDFVDLGFPQPKRYEFHSLEHVQTHVQDNFEGFVIKFHNGVRCKIKLDEYVRLHKIMTGVTPKTVLDKLSDGADFRAWLVKVPDEFYNYITEIADDYKSKYRKIEADARDYFNSVNVKSLSRNRIAEEFKKFDNPSILFSMLDNKDYSQQIWRMISNEK